MKGKSFKSIISEDLIQWNNQTVRKLAVYHMWVTRVINFKSSPMDHLDYFNVYLRYFLMTQICHFSPVMMMNKIVRRIRLWLNMTYIMKRILECLSTGMTIAPDFTAIMLNCLFQFLLYESLALKGWKINSSSILKKCFFVECYTMVFFSFSLWDYRWWLCIFVAFSTQTAIN